VRRRENRKKVLQKGGEKDIEGLLEKIHSKKEDGTKATDSVQGRRGGTQPN